MINILKASFIILFLSVPCGFSAKILFLFGGGNYSHKLSVWPMVMALTEKGHNITFVSSLKKQPKPNPKVTDITPSFMTELTDHVYQVDRIKDRKAGKEAIFTDYEHNSLNLCNLTMNSQHDVQFTNLIENGEFDLVVANAVYGECGLYIAHHLKSKVVIFDSTTIHSWYYGIFGFPIEASYIPTFQSVVDYPLSLWDRITVMYQYYKWYVFTHPYTTSMQEVYRKRFNMKEAPEFYDVARRASLLLVNSHYTADFPRSLPPMVVDIGGMHCWEPEGELPQNFKDFMNEAEDGVILISFGSTIEFNSLPEYYLSIFFNMMRKFSRIRFIWRWDGPLPDNHPKNLMAAKWLPQREILREKSVRGLMSHGGINSMLEATYYGVPVIAMPLFADQDWQAYRVQAQKIGVKVEFLDFTQELLDNAVWKFLNTPIYKKNMEIRSKLFRDRPNPSETAVSALEFVMKHEDLSILQPMELQQSFYVRQHIDVYFICFTGLVILNILVPYILFKCVKRIFS